MRLTEELAKAWLRDRGLPVPEGVAVHGAAEAQAAARELGGKVAVKALVAAGRRGKGGGVQIAGGPEAAGAAARGILGTTLAGRQVDRVYVEKAVEIRAEFYLSFAFGSIQPQVIVSAKGGIEIEDTAAADPDAIIKRDIDPLRGLSTWQAADLWELAGAGSALVPRLAALTAGLYQAFVDADALMLEINPLAVTGDGGLSIVGAMLEIDGSALFRHPQWQALALEDAGPGGRPLNERERSVVEADRKFPGGAVRYTELDGDIGLLVSGGGAGLLQHDLILAAGGRPANHSDLSPTPTPDKPAAILEAIFRNPRSRGLLLSYNFLQLAPCDMVIQALLLAMRRCKVDARSYPVIVRLFGPREDEARELAATEPGIRYLPHGASLTEAVSEIVTAVGQARRGATGAAGASGAR
jgi:succinyl-CoA synthetase beta subunit